MRERIRVEGVVQGVGFRPFVYALATRSGLSGMVGNDARGVFIEVEGEAQTVARFRGTLGRDAPPLAVVERVSSREVNLTGGTEFVIADSREEGPRQALVPPDTATCVDCLRELFDPGDRRYLYPFINCTNCGPRFSIVRDIPYDRPATTMAGFAMCQACAAEYHDPADRRFHAQPVCCPACGPVLTLRDRWGNGESGDPVRAAVAALKAGAVVAVKGLGGFHLAADAGSPAAVERLRARKHREDKAFAIMAEGLASVRRLGDLGEAEERALSAPGSPIVLVGRRADAPVADAVAPGHTTFGLMLPYTPVHHLLLREFGAPLVLTSGNISDEPIAYTEADAFARLGGVADSFLTHNRPIHTRTDDSVVRATRGRVVPVRRSRGHVPEPLRLEIPALRPVLACGAELKNTFCLAEGNRAFVSHHIGDLENYETLRSFTEGIEHFSRLFRIEPEVVAHDLHPEYLSTKYALDCPGSMLLGVQHHHAHIASCLADNRVAGPVIGVAFDGLGYGTDGWLWGGEFLVAGLEGFERAGHLEYVPMPGGHAAVTAPWKMAASYLDRAYGGDPPDDLLVARQHGADWATVRALGRAARGAGVNAPLTSSAGRLFDAVAAILRVRDTINYEGQAAVELERLAGEYGAVADSGAGYPGGIDDDGGSGPFRCRGTDLVRSVVTDLEAGVSPSAVAARFHRGVAGLIVAGCTRVRDATGLSTVALSGGVFQNQLLTTTAAGLLERRGFHVLLHRQLPANDGGISFGQAAVAAALGASANTLGIDTMA